MTLHQLLGAFPLQPPSRGGQAGRLPPALVVRRRQLGSRITAHAAMIAPRWPARTGIAGSEAVRVDARRSTSHRVGQSSSVAVSGTALAAAGLDAGPATVVRFAMRPLGSSPRHARSVVDG